MFKVRNLENKKEVDTEFWLEETGGSVLLKAKLSNQSQEFIIASIDENGMCIWRGIDENLGFMTIKRSLDDIYIKVRYG